jgi:Inorganic H+ pyrophosphatase
MLLENWLCLAYNDGEVGFPCSASAIEAVSLGLATGGLALLFTIFLTSKVCCGETRCIRSCDTLHPTWWWKWQGLLLEEEDPTVDHRQATPCAWTVIQKSIWHLPLLQLNAAPRGNDLMNKISDQIKSGARSFLVTEYTYLAIYIVVVFSILLVLYSVDPPSGDRTDGIRYAACFVAGGSLSAAAGWKGMVVATDANVRTTHAADKEGLDKALRVAFTGGAVMGFTVVGLGLFGLSFMFWVVTLGHDDAALPIRLRFAADSVAGFGFGASSIALFARVAGGIFTKAADVGRCCMYCLESLFQKHTTNLFRPL